MMLRTWRSPVVLCCLGIGAALGAMRPATTNAGDATPIRFASNTRQPSPPENVDPRLTDPPGPASIQLPLPRLEVDIRASEGMLPEDIALEYVRGQGVVAGDIGPRWYLSPYNWESPGLFHHPIYFEDVALERHGRSRCAALQPVLSAARAAGQFVILPLQMIDHRPLDCIYTHGYGKPRIPPIYPYPWCSPLCHNPYANYPMHPKELPAPSVEVLEE